MFQENRRSSCTQTDTPRTNCPHKKHTEQTARRTIEQKQNKTKQNKATIKINYTNQAAKQIHKPTNQEVNNRTIQFD